MEYVESVSELLDRELETCQWINEEVRRIKVIEQRTDYCGNPSVENLKHHIEELKSGLKETRKQIYKMLYEAASEE